MIPVARPLGTRGRPPFRSPAFFSRDTRGAETLFSLRKSLSPLDLWNTRFRTPPHTPYWGRFLAWPETRGAETSAPDRGLRTYVAPAPLFFTPHKKPPPVSPHTPRRSETNNLDPRDQGTKRMITGSWKWVAASRRIYPAAAAGAAPGPAARHRHPFPARGNRRQESAGRRRAAGAKSRQQVGGARRHARRRERRLTRQRKFRSWPSCATIHRVP